MMPTSTNNDLLSPDPVYEPLRKPNETSSASKTGKKKSMVRWKDQDKEHPYGQYTYVPLQHISPWMIRAAMTTEDNSFFKHHGFNWYALKDSVEDNIEAGGYVRGASTISMQLVKNVFLYRNKVLARKFQEAFLVWLMEDVADIPKARLLELYFNVIEYGPGIYGIHDAAVHYFGKRPDRLTLTEVAWLVSIVPNPKKYHIYYERGSISDAWFRHVLRYVRVMHNRGRVTELEYELAKDQKPEFYKPADGEPLMRLERDPSEFESLQDDTGQIEIPSLDDLFGP
jgi:membrane peptidoglycan carboxypeptidase